MKRKILNWFYELLSCLIVSGWLRSNSRLYDTVKITLDSFNKD
jgi:hypothetical protein